MKNTIRHTAAIVPIRGNKRGFQIGLSRTIEALKQLGKNA
jgi:hypothetical protein